MKSWTLFPLLFVLLAIGSLAAVEPYPVTVTNQSPIPVEATIVVTASPIPIVVSSPIPVTQSTVPWLISAPSPIPISATSLPLPTNAAKETGGNLDAIAASLAGTINAFVSGTVAVSNFPTSIIVTASSPLPVVVVGSVAVTGAFPTPYPSPTVLIGNPSVLPTPYAVQIVAMPSPPGGTTNVNVTNASIAVTGAFPTPTAPANQNVTVTNSALIVAVPSPVSVVGAFPTPATTVTVTSITNPVVVAVPSPVAVTGPLTDTQLRASDVNVNLTNASVAVTGAFPTPTAPANQNVTVTGSPSVIVANVSSFPTPAPATRIWDTTNYVTVTGANALKVDGSAVTQPVSGAFPTPYPSPTVLISGTVPVSIAGTVNVAGAFPTPYPSPTVLISGTVPVSGTFFQATQPVSIAAAVATNADVATNGTASATSFQNAGVFFSATPTPTPGKAYPLSIDSNANLYVKVANASLAVTGAFPTPYPSPTVLISGTVPVSGTFWQATQPVSGTVAVTGAPTPYPSPTVLIGNASVLPTPYATQAISAVSLPLPTGASTSANQSTEITSLQSIDGKMVQTFYYDGTNKGVNTYDGNNIDRPATVTINSSSAISFDVRGMGCVTFTTLVGTLSGVSLSMEENLDGNTAHDWNVNCTDLNTYQATSAYAVSGTQSWMCPVFAAKNFVLNPLSYTSGSGTVNLSMNRNYCGQVYGGNTDSNGRIKVAATATGSTAVNINTSGGSAINFGQAAMASSLPVALASNQSSIPVTGSGSFTVAQATASNLNATVVQATGTNLHAVLDATSTTAVTQATGTNLHTVVDSGTVSSKTQDSSGTGITSFAGTDGSSRGLATYGINDKTYSTTTTGAVVDFDCAGMGDIFLNFSGVFTGTIFFNGKNAGGISVGVPCVSMATTAGGGTHLAAYNTTAVGGWQCSCSGYKTFELSTSGMTGTATIEASVNANSSIINSVLTPITVDQATASRLNATVVGSGNFTVVQPTGTSLHAVLDTTSTTACTQATGTNLHMVSDSGSVAACTLAAETTKVIGTVNQGTSPWVSNTSQINGVTPLMDNGATGTGAQRVTVSNNSLGTSRVWDGTNIATVTAGNALKVDNSAVTQPDNVTQFGGTNISTGTGLGGAGIPRMTVSQDSAVKVWDGTNFMPPGDAVSRALFEKVTDGTNTATVKAASTAATSSDTSLVVAQSPTGGNPCQNPSSNLVGIQGSTSGTSATQIIAASGTTKIYICSMTITGVSGTTPTFSLVYGTGSNCVTGQTALLRAWTTAANTLYTFFGTVAITPASQALCYLDTGTTPIQGYNLTYVQQ